jgi:hypothetical protein
MSLDGYLPPESSSDSTFRDKSAGLCETAAPFHRSSAGVMNHWQVCHAQLQWETDQATVAGNPLVLPQADDRRRLREDFRRRETRYIRNIDGTSGDEYGAVHGFSFPETPICTRSTTAIIRSTLDESMRILGQSLT